MQQNETTWYDRMVRKLQINGKSERTQEAYTRAVRQLREHYKKDLALITERELEDYFLFRRNESKWAPKTLRLCYYGIRFYFKFVLNIDWNLFSILKAQKEERLPEIPAKETILNVFSRRRSGSYQWSDLNGADESGQCPGRSRSGGEESRCYEKNLCPYSSSRLRHPSSRTGGQHQSNSTLHGA